MEDLPEALLAEIIARITRTNDLNSLSLVSKWIYINEAYQRSKLRISCGLCPAREALTSLCFRFPNLSKVEIDYSDWKSNHGNHLDNKGLLVISSLCSLTDLALSFCSRVNDSGLGCLADCKKLVSFRLNSTPEITSSGLLAVAVGCKRLSTLHIINCEKIESKEWLEYLGWNGSLAELVVKKCNRINQYDDLLKFGPGWMKLQKFEFDIKFRYWGLDNFDPLYNAHNPSRYDFCCESLKDLRLARFGTETEVGLRFLFGKCKALEKLCLDYVDGLNDNDMIALSQSCSNLRSISLRLTLQYYDFSSRTAFTDDSLKALGNCCPLLEAVELTFYGVSPDYSSEIGFTQRGLVGLLQSCPIRVLVLNRAYFFNDDGMKALSTAPFLETLELLGCGVITDAGLRFIACNPCLTNLTLRMCHHVTDAGVAELVHAQKLESVIIESCSLISRQAAQGAARSVHYSESIQPGFFQKNVRILLLKWSPKAEVIQLFLTVVLA